VQVVGALAENERKAKALGGKRPRDDLIGRGVGGNLDPGSRSGEAGTLQSFGEHAHAYFEPVGLIGRTRLFDAHVMGL
jgi:hypothetical protein